MRSISPSYDTLAATLATLLTVLANDTSAIYRLQSFSNSFG